MFRVVRRYMAERPDSGTQALILSARYGLIRGEEETPDYDEPLGRARASAIRPATVRQLMSACRDIAPEATLVAMGRAYMTAIQPYDAWEGVAGAVTVLAGGMGPRLTALSQWLYGDEPPCPSVARRPTTLLLPGGEPATAEDVARVARAMAANGTAETRTPSTWHAVVDGRPIPAKRLVSQLTGNPVGAFHTSAARAGLHDLGIEVRAIHAHGAV